MDSMFLLVAIFFPIIFGAMIPLFCKNKQNTLFVYVGIVTIITSILTWILIITCNDDVVNILSITKNLVWRLKFDHLGKYFAGIIATLWPFTILYSFDYMNGKERLVPFFTFFTMTYGITLGISMSANIFTLYTFYELLTLSTLPLIMYELTKPSIRATRYYLVFSIGGAAFAFATLMYILSITNADFTYGGILSNIDNNNIMMIFYVVGFLGFGVKSALFPTHNWLPKASVAPTPVTALLHAIAVVKSGAFGIIRLTYFVFGTELLIDSWAQKVVMCFAMFTILFGASKAVKEQHFKRRLAYSTIANLSYILLGVTFMTEAGLTGALLHLAFHSQIKILAFFIAGAVLHKTKREYIWELNGIGKKMPITFASFIIASLALVGIPPLSGFVSKWHLLVAGAATGNVWGYAGSIVLLISALLTAIYMLTVVIRAFFPVKNSEDGDLSTIKEADIKMLIPMVILAISIVVVGIFANPIVSAISAIASGL